MRLGASRSPLPPPATLAASRECSRRGTYAPAGGLTFGFAASPINAVRAEHAAAALSATGLGVGVGLGIGLGFTSIVTHLPARLYAWLAVCWSRFMDPIALPECCVCLQPYDDVQRLPYVLNCGHSLCLACTGELPAQWATADQARAAAAAGPTAVRPPPGSVIRCPECNQRTKVPLGGAMALPRNIELMRLINSIYRWVDAHPMSAAAPVSAAAASSSSNLSSISVVSNSNISSIGGGGGSVAASAAATVTATVTATATQPQLQMQAQPAVQQQYAATSSNMGIVYPSACSRPIGIKPRANGHGIAPEPHLQPHSQPHPQMSSPRAFVEREEPLSPSPSPRAYQEPARSIHPGDSNGMAQMMRNLDVAEAKAAEAKAAAGNDPDLLNQHQLNQRHQRPGAGNVVDEVAARLRDAPCVVKHKEWQGHANLVVSVAICDPYFVTAGHDRVIKIWSLESLDLMQTIADKHSSKINALIVHPESKLGFSGDSGGNIFVWNVGTLSHQPLLTWRDRDDYMFAGVECLATSPDVCITDGVVTGIVYGGCKDKSIKAWRMENGTQTLLATMDGHTFHISRLLVDHEMLYSCCWDGTVRLWWREDHTPLTCFGQANLTNGQRGTIRDIAIDGGLLYVARDKGSIQVWRDENMLGSVNGHTATLSAICVHGNWLYSGGLDNFLKAWKLVPSILDSGAEIVGSAGGDGSVVCLAAYDNRVYAGFTDGYIRVQVYRQPKHTGEFQGENEIFHCEAATK